MTKCKYFDCGWCYAPSDIKTNATQSGCFEPEHCPYLKSQNQMTNETDIAKVLIEGDTATINGVKYKRVEEPKPKTLYDLIGNWWDNVFVVHNACNNETAIDYLVNDIEKWLPDELEYDGEEYHLGWNDALRTIKDNLR
jgi:hypothetical protein